MTAELVDEVIRAVARFTFRKTGESDDCVLDRARARVAKGIKIAHLLAMLTPRTFEERTRILREILNSRDFVTLPKIAGPVRDVEVDPRTGAVALYTDRTIIPGDDYRVRLSAPYAAVPDIEAATKLAMLMLKEKEGPMTKTELGARLREEGLELSRQQLLVVSRRAHALMGLKPNRGRPKKCAK